MMGKRMVRIFGLVAVLLLTALLSAQQMQAAPMQQTNLLQNSSFEQPYLSDGAATSWVRWHENSSEDQFNDCANGYHKLPKWSAETVSGGLIHSGSASQHVGNQWDTWHAGVWQTVPVTPGSRYRFTVYAIGRGSNDNYPAASESGLRMDVRAGIDPNGSGLWLDSDVVWSSTINPHDQWQSVSVEATAVGNSVTVFTSADWGQPGVNQCRKHLDVWFDTAELIEVGPPPTNTPPPQPTQPPPPPATSTPSPVPATATSEIPPTETPIPATETPTTPPGGSICVNAFADDNANGVRDANEGYMGNVTFTVANAAQVVGQAVSTGTANAFCFEGLEPGAYQVAQIVPGRLQMTTAANATIQVEAGSTVGVEFGSRVAPDQEAPAATTPAGEEVAGLPDPTIAPGETDNAAADEGGPSLLAVSGLVAMVLAVLLLGGLLFLVLRRSAS